MTRPKVSVDVWSDVMCPWCAVGYAQFTEAVARLEGEIEVETRWMPFELNPDLPPEGVTQEAHLAKVYGRSPDELARMQETMLARAREVGFPMTARGPDGQPAMMWNTFEAHKLLRWVLAEQGPEAQTRMKLALLEAHFRDHRQVGMRDVLLEIASEQGFDRANAAEALDDEALGMATRLEERRGIEAGIDSVPSFVFAGRYLVPGAQDPAVFVETVRKVAALASGAVGNA